MQVFGLPGQMIRNGWAASRLLAAKTPDIEAGRRHDAARGWRRAMADGLAAGAGRQSRASWQAPAPMARDGSGATCWKQVFRAACTRSNA